MPIKLPDNLPPGVLLMVKAPNGRVFVLRDEWSKRPSGYKETTIVQDYVLLKRWIKVNVC